MWCEQVAAATPLHGALAMLPSLTPMQGGCQTARCGPYFRLPKMMVIDAVDVLSSVLCSGPAAEAAAAATLRSRRQQVRSTV